MGRHSDVNHARRAPAQIPFLKQIPHWRLPQKLLGLFLMCSFLATGAATIIFWPAATPAHIQQAFQAAAPVPQTSANGQVAVVVTAACGSPDLGRVFETSPKEPTTTTGKCTRAIVLLTSGPDQGKRTLLETAGQPGEPQLQVGDKIVLNQQHTPDGSLGYTFADYQRSGTIIWWLLLTAAAMIVIGAWRGARSLLGLLITMVVLICFLLPALLRGGPPVLLAVTSCAIILFFVIPLVHGFNWKAAAALAGTTCSLGVTALLAHWGIAGTKLRGLGDEDNLLVLLYLPDVSIHGLMLAGFIIGAIGALNDATVAQAATVNELAAFEPEANPWQLFRSGMKVGRDHLASMLYTLVLSYTGAALPLLLLLTAAGRPLIQTLTSDVIATEIVRSAIGAIALALAVPATTFIAAVTVNPKPADKTRPGHLHHH